MTSVSSLSGQAGVSPFNLETQRGVAHVLSSVRASNLNSEQKNELRDLIFLYANGGRDQSVRLTLEQKLIAYQVSALPIPEHDTSRPGSMFHPFGGDFRTDPTFDVTASPFIVAPAASGPPSGALVPPSESHPVVTSTVPVTAQVAPYPQQTYSAPSVSSPVSAVPAVAPSPAPVVAPSTIPVPPQPTVVAPLQASPTTVVPIAAPQANTFQPPLVQTQPFIAPTPVSSALATPAPSVVPAPATVPTSSLVEPPQEQALTRIRDIKARVNEKVGNPVNLVDIDNVVGREYMSALLDAMKKLNSGSSVAPAMQRLEVAYAQVERVLAAHAVQSVPAPLPTAVAATAPVSSPVVAVPQPAPTSLPVARVPEQAIPTPPAGAVSVPVLSATPASPIAPPPSPLSSPSQPPPPQPAPAPSPSPSPSPMPVATQYAPVTPNPIPVSVTPAPSVPSAPQLPSLEAVPTRVPVVPAVEESVKKVTPEPTVATATSGTPLETKFTSLAQSDLKLRTPTDLPTATEKYSSDVAADPLFAPDVDEGLQQLLVEWKIFRKSGLFGTGPKGREHPLFVKIAKLQIPLILAGRFEGSTQEIKQSITDYMNGWRYEQGIIYEQGETFEHYLRRIIRHILNLQRRRKGS